MKNEILWFIRLGRDQKLFTRDEALGVMKAVGREAELMDFAQRLIDDEIVSDVDKLEAIAGNAMARAQVGPPDGNPLLDDTMPPMPVASARRRRRWRLALRRPAQGGFDAGADRRHPEISFRADRGNG